ncbi:MAG: 6,7-dimethyl-8-ribityllumazine synthase [Methylothermaceae bacteria B42]|nr:MAG: 6,7-dimethyl-8-ribityllumazine synthase [Methylothermaceae bacteria B42]HHJ37935.1 6,7-dimethyl-8-ribityllumazine synthase [Methylothermaceae bacterium]
MTEIKTLEGALQATGMRFAIVAARFNGFIVEQLVQGAVDGLVRHGAEPANIRILKTPGAFELPLAIEAVAEHGGVDAIIALGVVIRGATPHFDYVAGECVKGISAVTMKYKVPVAFGVLTTDTIEQAIERAGTKAGNKGFDAAMTAIEMVDLLRQIKNS